MTSLNIDESQRFRQVVKLKSSSKIPAIRHKSIKAFRCSGELKAKAQSSV